MSLQGLLSLINFFPLYASYYLAFSVLGSFYFLPDMNFIIWGIECFFLLLFLWILFKSFARMQISYLRTGWSFHILLLSFVWQDQSNTVSGTNFASLLKQSSVEKSISCSANYDFFFLTSWKEQELFSALYDLQELFFLIFSSCTFSSLRKPRAEYL